MRTFLISFLAFVISTTAFASELSFTCNEDDRDRDGGLRKLELLPNSSGTHDVYFEMAPGGYQSSWPTIERMLIVPNLTCKYSEEDPSYFNCQNDNFGSAIAVHIKRSYFHVATRDHQGEMRTVENIEMSVSSPILAAESLAPIVEKLTNFRGTDVGRATFKFVPSDCSVSKNE